MEIKINKLGRVIKGKHPGWYIKVVDDREGSTGGAYIYYADKRDGSGTVYKHWLENFEFLESYFAEDDDEVEWLE